MTAVELILIVLATARLTRLITQDAIFDGPRNRLILRLNNWPTVQYLILCPWCISIYTGTAMAGAWMIWDDSRWFVGALAALSASYVTGHLAERNE